MMVDMHHIVFDAASMIILFREFQELYQGKSLSPLRLQYKEYAAWLRDENQRESIQKEAHFWLNEFAREIPVLDLPTDYPRPAVQRFAGSIESFNLNLDETRAIKALASEHGATLFMVLLSIYSIFLARISNQEDIVVGTPVSTRGHADLQRVMGIFLNTLALRNSITLEKPFLTLLKEIRLHTIAAFDHRSFPFEDLVEQAAVKRDLSRSPIFDAMFILHDELPHPEIPPEEIPGLTLIPVNDKEIPRTSKFDLTLISVETGTGLFFTFEYSTALFKKKSLNRYILYFKNIITGILSCPGQRISQLNILPAGERKQLLQTFNTTAADYPREKTLHRLFEDQVLQRPDKIAVVCEDKGLTHWELNMCINRLARLLQNYGVKHHSIVGLMPDRSLEIITGLYAILKAGGAYLPIGPELPPKRIAYVLKESQTKLLLAHQRENLTDLSQLPCQWINLDKIVNDDNNAINLPHNENSADTAYVIYTSGSTGGPKGVVIRHQAVVNFIRAM
jgi:non-ribosomal peptide synthetase component F